MPVSSFMQAGLRPKAESGEGTVCPDHSPPLVGLSLKLLNPPYKFYRGNSDPYASGIESLVDWMRLRMASWIRWMPSA